MDEYKLRWIHKVTDGSVLKPSQVNQVIRVNQVMFFPGHSGQTHFKNYLDLT